MGCLSFANTVRLSIVHSRFPSACLAPTHHYGGVASKPILSSRTSHRTITAGKCPFLSGTHTSDTKMSSSLKATAPSPAQSGTRAYANAAPSSSNSSASEKRSPAMHPSYSEARHKVGGVLSELLEASQREEDGLKQASVDSALASVQSSHIPELIYSCFSSPKYEEYRLYLACLTATLALFRKGKSAASPKPKLLPDIVRSPTEAELPESDTLAVRSGELALTRRPQDATTFGP